MMGNVVYMHASTRKLFMEVGNLLSSAQELKQIRAL